MLTNQIVTSQCQNTMRLSKKSLLAIIENNNPIGYWLDPNIGTDVFFVERKHFLTTIDYNSWEIVSFNPTNKSVCVRVTNPSGARTILNFTMPNF